MKMPKGSTYVYALRGDEWDIEIYTPTGDEVHTTLINIDGRTMLKFSCPDGVDRAILPHACRRDVE